MTVEETDDYIREVLVQLLWEYLEIIHTYCATYKLEYLRQVSKAYIKLRNDYEQIRQYHRDPQKDEHIFKGLREFKHLYAKKHNTDIFKKLLKTYTKVYSEPEYKEYRVCPQVHTEATMGMFYAYLAATLESNRSKVDNSWLEFFKELTKVFDAYVWKVAPDANVYFKTTDYLLEDIKDFRSRLQIIYLSI